MLGDKFVFDSSLILESLFNLTNAELAQQRKRAEDSVPQVGDSYICQHYDVEVFASNSLDNSRSALGRLRNILTKSLESHKKFPKYIIFVIEDDLLRCINFNKSGVSEIYGEILKWLTSQVRDLILKRKNDLPLRSKKYLYPQVFWVELPLHESLNNQLRIKFNQCLGSIVALYNEMKVLKIKRKWSYEDLSLVSAGQINGDGKLSYWCGIDEALQFWENGKKRQHKVGSGREFIKKMRFDHDEQQIQRATNDKWNWNCNKQVWLPKPPPSATATTSSREHQRRH